MEFDLTAHLAKVERHVVSGTRNGQRSKAVVIARTVPAPVKEVWDALTNPERLPKWFLPISGDLREGGRYQLEGNASGVITGCREPELIEATWEFGGEVSWVTVRVGSDDGGTRIELEHEAIVDDKFWPDYGPGAAGVGWDSALVGLVRHLEDPAEDVQDPAWMAEHGVELNTAASEAWGRAAIADGTPEAEALAQADRTRAFYLGEEA